VESSELEQRTGRIDRIGSMAERLAAEDGATTAGEITVWLPYMNGTYDETIFLRVTSRRREFRCILGNLPEWDPEEDEEAGGLPIDEKLVARLQVQLGPQ
jgi:hypothetical protein